MWLGKKIESFIPETSDYDTVCLYIQGSHMYVVDGKEKRILSKRV